MSYSHLINLAHFITLDNLPHMKVRIKSSLLFHPEIKQILTRRTSMTVTGRLKYAHTRGGRTNYCQSLLWSDLKMSIITCQSLAQVHKIQLK